jgi:hypothetical protein
MKKQSTIGILALLCFSQTLFAQGESEPVLTLDRLLWISPNIESSNAAALSLLSTELPDFTSCSDIKLIFNYEEGRLGGPRTSKSARDIIFSTKSIQRLGNTYLVGYFDYRFQNFNEARWVNLFNPESYPNTVSDSIPGPIVSETFFAGVKIAHPIKNHTFGVTMNYMIGKRGKTIDLRNENDKMYFEFLPGWMLQQRWGNIGFDFGYHRTMERVNYSEVVDGDAKILFRLEGLWFFQDEVFTTNSDFRTRLTRDDGYMANLKLDLKFGNMAWYNRIGVSYSDVKHQGNTVREELFGEQETLKYTYISTLKLSPRSQVRMRYQNNTLLAYNLLQREERTWAGHLINRTYAKTKHYT